MLQNIEFALNITIGVAFFQTEKNKFLGENEFGDIYLRGRWSLEPWGRGVHLAHTHTHTPPL